MNTKRSTPQHTKSSNKGPLSASKYRTPPHSNLTFIGRSESTSKPHYLGSSSKPLKSQLNLNSTCIGNPSSAPSIKGSLASLSPAFIDYNADCDCAYSEYLQALMKEKIAITTFHSHESDMNQQLAIQKDKLYQSKFMLKKTNQDILKLEKQNEITDLVQSLDESAQKFFELTDNYDFCEMLKQLLSVLNWFCNRISVKNVKTLDGEDDFHKLNLTLQKFIKVFDNMNLHDRNVDKINQLAGVMKQYQESIEAVTQKRKSINSLQKNEAYNLLKQISNMYVEKEKFLHETKP